MMMKDEKIINDLKKNVTEIEKIINDLKKSVMEIEKRIIFVLCCFL